ncbi:MAG: NUDIX hydrolase [Myxococcales bacterium]|nr:NUDIX hydrolase [Myxococcales bacterium]
MQDDYQHKGPFVEARASATVVPLVDGPRGLEVLLLRRNRALSFHGGDWVFPGGSVDAADAGAAGCAPGDEAACRRAAVREAQEEASLVLSPDALVPLSHWTTPVSLPKRFATWFFASEVRSRAVAIDGGEIRAHRWMRPADALAARDAHELGLPPPTFVTLDWLARFDRVAEAIEAARRRPPPRYLPRFRLLPEGVCCIYNDDAAYEDGDVERPGRRDRLWLSHERWRYEHDT